MLERYVAFRDNCTLKQQLRPGETANDAWFAEQRDAFQRGEDSWLEEEASGTAVAAAMVTNRHSNLGRTHRSAYRLTPCSHRALSAWPAWRLALQLARVRRRRRRRRRS